MNFSEYQIDLPETFRLNFQPWDEQHSIILGVFRFMISSSFDGNLGDIVMELAQYSKEHFQLEAKFMKAVGFPEEEDHHQEHKMFNDKLIEFKESVHAKNDPKMEIINFLSDWFKNHINENDRKISNFVRENPQSYDSPLLK